MTAERMRTSASPRPFDSRDVRASLGLSIDNDSGVREYTGVSTDSRTILTGELFIALAGERHDAADFLPNVAERGAFGAIVTAGREDRSLPLEYFAVPDPTVALGNLAAHRRRTSGVRVIGITGSSGKTTVKEMVACALGEGRRVYRTEGNLNSQVGVPLMILRAPEDADIWVLEMGASEPGEIPRLVEIAAPDDAVVTTIGPAHLEQFSDEVTVLDEKLSLVRGASPSGFVVVGELPSALSQAARRVRPDTIVAGLGDGADYVPENYGVEAERAWFERAGVRFEIEVGGEHHLRDALMAAAIAEALGVDPTDVARGLSGYRALGMRSALRQIGPLTVVADCYNANPESFVAAIDYCRDLFPGRRLTAFVGTMLELGAAEDEAHREIAERLVEAGFSLVAATGAFEPAARAIGDVNGIQFVVATDPAQAWEGFASSLRGDEVVLVKGSHGVHLEKIVDRLADRFGDEGEEMESA
jgi:UDP-N-acetylmuramoyl-tripeptide--D-alanyl-D-alanine ligase